MMKLEEGGGCDGWNGIEGDFMEDIRDGYESG